MHLNQKVFSTQRFPWQKKRKDNNINLVLALLLFENPQEDMNAFKGLLTKMDLDDMMFYLAVPGGKNSETLSWFQVISLSSGSVIEEIRFHPDSLRIFQDFNLQGLSVTSTSLSWPPFYEMGNCDHAQFEKRGSLFQLPKMVSLDRG